MSPIDGKGISRIVIGCLMAIASVYIFQGYFIRYRLDKLDAVKVTLGHQNQYCDEQNCTATWSFSPQQRFLLLGQIIRTYKITAVPNGEEILPINQVQGTVSDAWSRLRVYKITPGNLYQLTAVKPKTTRMNYFAGLDPRTTDHEGVLSIPQVGPTLSSFAAIISVFLLATVFVAATISRSEFSHHQHSHRKIIHAYVISALFLTIAVFTSLGTFDTLFTEGDARNKIIRISTLISLITPLVAQTSLLSQRFFPIKIGLVIILSAYLGHLAWPFLRGGAPWALTLTAISLIGIYQFARMNQYLGAIFWSSALIDAAKIAGLFQIPDYPPIYIFNVCSFLALTIVAGNLGGFSTIKLAGIAYRRFKRDVLLSAIKHKINNGQSADSSAKIIAIRSNLSEIAEFTKAGRVALAINLPLGRPIILSYDRDEDKSTIYDDGTIPGVITIRTLLYGDTAIFESFSDFCKKRDLTTGREALSAKLFCAIPIKVNKTIIGSMMLTKFNDHQIEKNLSRKRTLNEAQENLMMLASTLSTSLAELMVYDLDKSSSISKLLHQAIHREISLASSADDFICRYANSIAMICGVHVIVHENVHDEGIAKACSGLSEEAWFFFKDNPLNLRPDAKPAFGPTVVAFRDQKSSFVTDIRTIKKSLHPKTNKIMEMMGTQSLASVPIRSDDRYFAVTALTNEDTVKADPFIVSIIESTEALFLAAVNVMSQKSSAIALGTLTSRLIGDEHVRQQIIQAAKSKSLPTTIGSPKTSFLFLIDLAGSSNISHDTENKARAYGDFYDAVNRKSHELLSATIRKTIGDAVIVTWDGHENAIAEDLSFLSHLEELASFADDTARKIGCKGARSILHHGQYFLGLVGTETFGQIDVIGTGIDEVCKMESLMKGLEIDGKPVKLAISESAVTQLKGLIEEDFLNRHFHNVSSQAQSNLRIQFAGFLRTPDEANIYVA